MVTHMQDNKAPAKTLAKPPAEKKSKWTKDDTELSILALPTTIGTYSSAICLCLALSSRSRIIRLPLARAS